MEAYPNVMIDLETLGKVPGCAVLSVGAVMFDLEKDIVGPMFHQYVSFRDNVLLGLDLDPDTMRWWLGAGMVEAANDTIPASMASRLSVRDVLENLHEFILHNSGNNPDVKAWSNGGNFDHPILTVLRQRAGVGDPPYRFWNEKCYRTLKDFYKERLAGAEVKVAPATLKHNAGADADYQARVLLAWHARFLGLTSQYEILPEAEEKTEAPLVYEPDVVHDAIQPTALPGGLGAPELALGKRVHPLGIPEGHIFSTAIGTPYGEEKCGSPGLFIPAGSNPNGKDGTGKTD